LHANPAPDLRPHQDADDNQRIVGVRPVVQDGLAVDRQLRVGEKRHAVFANVKGFRLENLIAGLAVNFAPNRPPLRRSDSRHNSPAVREHSAISSGIQTPRKNEELRSQNEECRKQLRVFHSDF
jgi:hypothetical protein